jgi:hypothetical protein
MRVAFFPGHVKNGPREATLTPALAAARSMSTHERVIHNMKAEVELGGRLKGCAGHCVTWEITIASGRLSRQAYMISTEFLEAPDLIIAPFDYNNCLTQARCAKISAPSLKLQLLNPARTKFSCHRIDSVPYSAHCELSVRRENVDLLCSYGNHYSSQRRWSRGGANRIMVGWKLSLTTWR